MGREGAGRERRKEGDGERETGRGRREEGDGKRKTGRGRWEERDEKRETGIGRRGEGDGERERGGGQGFNRQEYKNPVEKRVDQRELRDSTELRFDRTSIRRLLIIAPLYENRFIQLRQLSWEDFIAFLRPFC